MGLPELVVFDVDGTLITYDGRCDPRTRATLARLRHAGVATAIATGRPFGALTEAVDLVGPVDYAVCSNGGLVVVMPSGDVVSQSVMEGRLVRPLIETARNRIPGIGVAVDIGERTIEELGFDRRIPERLVTEPVSDVLAELPVPCPDVSRVIFFHDDFDHDLAALGALLEPILDPSVAFSGAGMLTIAEVAPAGVNKAVALQGLIDHLGIDVSDTMAFGDGTNDVEMLAWAGTGVAMANAADLTKAAADITTVAVDEGGVSVILEPLLQAHEDDLT